MTKSKNLIGWFSGAKAERYFGQAFSIRADVLAYLVTGNGTLTEIALAHGVTKQAAQKQARRAREIYFGRDKK